MITLWIANLAQLGPNLAPTWPSSWAPNPTWPHLGTSWRQLAPTWPQLGPTWPQLGPNLAPSCAPNPTWPQLGPSWRQLSPTWPQLGLTWPHLGPTWLYLDPTWLHLGLKVTPCFDRFLIKLWLLCSEAFDRIFINFGIHFSTQARLSPFLGGVAEHFLVNI